MYQNCGNHYFDWVNNWWKGGALITMYCSEYLVYMHIYKYSYLRATALKTFTCSRNFNKHYHLAQTPQTATRLTKNKLYSYIVFVNSFTLVFICWFIFKHWIPFCAINFKKYFQRKSWSDIGVEQKPISWSIYMFRKFEPGLEVLVMLLMIIH